MHRFAAAARAARPAACASGRGVDACRRRSRWKRGAHAHSCRARRAPRLPAAPDRGRLDDTAAAAAPAPSRAPPRRRVRHEQQVVAMFVDLRDSTALGETRLPYDVVFILNQFFAEMSEALKTTGGHYSTFAGDGLMALYGTDDDLPGLPRRDPRRNRDPARLARINAALSADLASRYGPALAFTPATRSLGRWVRRTIRSFRRSATR